MSDPVHAQYEALPYPPRDPRDEARRLLLGSPSSLPEIEHHVFGGTLDRTRRFRALVAGGGTGDATTMLAQQLADARIDAEIVHLDWSQASRRIAEARIAARGLANVRFVTASLLDLPTLGLGSFDYIDCCGVLHHLEDPPGALALLADALGEAGGMGLMLYGRLGRRGVYDLQAVLRAVGEADAGHAQRIELARRLIATLPPTNWFVRNPFIGDHVTQGDAGLADLLLHARDRAYTVDEIAALATGAGLRLVAFTPAARYTPELMVSDARVKARLARLPAEQKPGVAEALAGNIKSHVFYVVRRGNPVSAPAPGPRAVPVPFNADFVAAARTMKPGAAVSVTIEGLRLTLPLPRRAPLIAAQIDGARDLRAIHAGLAAAELSWDAFMAEFAAFYGAFHALGKLMLRVPAGS